ncbi:MAG: glycosyltransferase [bacterium]
MDETRRPVRLAVVQCFLPEYRVPVFRRLAALPSLEMTLYFGAAAGRRYKKYRSVPNAEGIPHRRLRTIPLFVALGGRVFSQFFHPALVFHLIAARPDVVLLEGESNLANNLLTVPLCLLMRIPYVWWGLGRFRREPESVFRRLFRPVVRFMLSRAAAVIGYSEFARAYYVSQGARGDRTFVARNTIDTDLAFESASKYAPLVEGERRRLGLEGKKVMLFVGAIERTKRLENALLAFESLKAKHPELGFLIVGDGEDRPRLETLAAERGIRDVVFAGAKFEDVSLYFLTGDVFVLPGLGGLHIPHAMCHSLPVVASFADGTEEELITNGENGFIVERNDVGQLAEAIGKIVADPALAAAMGRRSRRIIEEKFNVHNMIGAIEKAVLFAGETGRKR